MNLTFSTGRRRGTTCLFGWRATPQATAPPALNHAPSKGDGRGGRWPPWLLLLSTGMVVAIASQALASVRWRARLMALEHELRTPLGLLRTLAATALAHGHAIESRPYWQLTLDLTSMLQQRVGLGLGRMRRRLSRSTRGYRGFDPARLCRQVLVLMQPWADARGLHLQLGLGPDLPAALWGDPVRIEQVLLNLLGNAITYTRAGQIDLRSDWRDGRWWLWVADTGPGIARRQRAQVWRRGRRLLAAAAVHPDGQGLGLALSRDWVRAMRGRISLHGREIWPDSSVLSGCVVRIELPWQALPG